MSDNKHKNDMYGDDISARSEDDEGVTPPIPAATVVLLRDGSQGPEVLMLRKNSKITFGGMWVFPGGKIDAEDYAGGYTGEKDADAAARRAAAREAQEEANIDLAVDDFVHFAHWTPPPGPQKRFATWFFAAEATEAAERVAVDQGEIEDHQWIRPSDALERHAAGEIDIVPPTWVTLHHISLRAPTIEVLQHFRRQAPKVYSTRVVKASTGERVAMWAGDAGYEAWDADVDGARHRLVMKRGGFEFENTVEAY